MKNVIIGGKGGSVQVIDRGTGEVLAEVPLAPGVYPLARFAPLRGGNVLAFSNGSLAASVGNSRSIKPVGQFDSAANPFFRVSPAQREIRELTRMMRRTEALAKRAERASRDLSRARAAAQASQLPAPGGGAPAGGAPGGGADSAGAGQVSAS